jgi:hypothetical protein
MVYEIPQAFKHLKTAYRLTEKLLDIISFIFIFLTLSMLILSGSPFAREAVIFWLYVVIADAILSLIAAISIGYYFYLKPINKTLTEELRFIKDFIQWHRNPNEAISLNNYKKVWWIFVLIRRTVNRLKNRERNFLDLRSKNCLKTLVKNLDHIKKILKVLKIKEMGKLSIILEEYAKVFENCTYADLYIVDKEFKNYIENNVEYKNFLSDEDKLRFKSKLYGFFKKIDLFGIVNKIVQNKDRIFDFIKFLTRILLGILSITVIIYWIYNYQTIANLPGIIMEIIKTFF